ncbi:MAG TPA: hypothetical protein VMW36_01295 [Patescibacteria group bacterium]|nr:hypothetical protein [Patescibacteria group bacterium]
MSKSDTHDIYNGRPPTQYEVTKMMTDSRNEIYGKELERFVNFTKENGV